MEKKKWNGITELEEKGNGRRIKEGEGKKRKREQTGEPLPEKSWLHALQLPLQDISNHVFEFAKLKLEFTKLNL